MLTLDLFKIKIQFRFTKLQPLKRPWVLQN
jgi:hypothetical protein